MESRQNDNAPARQRSSSGTPWEPMHGYSRAMRAGNLICVSETVGVEPDGTVAPSTYRQAQRSLAIIRQALEDVGARLEDVVRTRVFVTDITQFEQVAQAHREVFGDIRPASTLVEVSRFVRDDFLLEIEADALVLSPNDS